MKKAEEIGRMTRWKFLMWRSSPSSLNSLLGATAGSGAIRARRRQTNGETRIHPPSRGYDMPTCPKCGEMISAQRYERHLKRCGTDHKNKDHTLDHPENFFMKI
jgi:hypothetical protein